MPLGTNYVEAYNKAVNCNYIASAPEDGASDDLAIGCDIGCPPIFSEILPSFLNFRNPIGVMSRRVLKILASPYLELSEYNPVQSLLYGEMAKHDVRVSGFSTRKLLQESWDVWHLHWPEKIINKAHRLDAFVALLKFWAQLKLARLKKIKVFWTAHNLRPHEREHPWLERIFWRIFLPNIDGIISMSDIGRQQLCLQHPRARAIPMFVIPHGHYRGVYPDYMNKDEARRALGIGSDQFVATYIGQIRPYKGVVPLIQCFTQAQFKNAELLIVGKPVDDEIMREVEGAAAINPRVRVFPNFVDGSDIQKFLRASDLIILPYKEILNSGSAILALSFDRPILVPALGALAELRKIVGSDWVRLYEGDLSPEIIRNAIRWTKARKAGPDARAPLEGLNWYHIAQLTVHAFLWKHG